MRDDASEKSKKKTTYLFLLVVCLIAASGWAFANYKIGAIICWLSDRQACSFNMPPLRPAPPSASHSDSASN